MGIVAAASPFARLLIAAGLLSPDASASATGASTSSIVFWPRSDLPRTFMALTAAASARPTSTPLGEAPSSLPSVRNNVP